MWSYETLERANTTIITIYKDGTVMGSLSLTEKSDIEKWQRIITGMNPQDS